MFHFIVIISLSYIIINDISSSTVVVRHYANYFSFVRQLFTLPKTYFLFGEKYVLLNTLRTLYSIHVNITICLFILYFHFVFSKSCSSINTTIILFSIRSLLLVYNWWFKIILASASLFKLFQSFLLY